MKVPRKSRIRGFFGLWIVCTLFWSTALTALTRPALAQFSYEVVNGSLTITNYDGPPGNVYIPASINGLAVRRLGVLMFKNSGPIGTITIPDTVTNALWGSFGGNFWTANTFSFAKRVTGIKVGSGNAYYSSTNGILFNKTMTEIVAYPTGRIGGYTIPDSVNSIGWGAFQNCGGLNRLEIPLGLTNIDLLAFANCTNLTTLRFPEGLRYVSGGMCGGCQNLTEVIFPASLESFVGDSFGGCMKLKFLRFEGNPPSVATFLPFAWRDLTTGVWYPIACYVPGNTNWPSRFLGMSTEPWRPILQTSKLDQQRNRFECTVNWADNHSFVIQASTNLAEAAWIPALTNTTVQGSFSFLDPQWTNSVQRFYRVKVP